MSTSGHGVCWQNLGKIRQAHFHFFTFFHVLIFLIFFCACSFFFFSFFHLLIFLIFVCVHFSFFFFSLYCLSFFVFLCGLKIVMGLRSTAVLQIPMGDAPWTLICRDEVPGTGPGTNCGKRDRGWCSTAKPGDGINPCCPQVLFVAS